MIICLFSCDFLKLLTEINAVVETLMSTRGEYLRGIPQ